MCSQARSGVVVNVSRDAAGQTYPETLMNEADLCPASWEHLGGLSYSAACIGP